MRVAHVSFRVSKFLFAPNTVRNHGQHKLYTTFSSSAPTIGFERNREVTESEDGGGIEKKKSFATQVTYVVSAAAAARLAIATMVRPKKVVVDGFETIKHTEMPFVNRVEELWSLFEVNATNMHNIRTLVELEIFSHLILHPVLWFREDDAWSAIWASSGKGRIGFASKV
jgi:hypothetical protein